MDFACHHSFSLGLSGVAAGDINPSVDTYTGAVMCHRAVGSCGREKWITHPDTGNFFNRETIYASTMCG